MLAHLSQPLPLLARFARGSQGDPSAWGKASTTVHTTAEQALAFLWLYCSNLRMKEHHKKDGNLLRQVYEPVTTDTNAPSQYHTQHIVVQKSMPPPFRTRESNMRYVWDETNNNNEERFKTLIMAFEPAEINFISLKRKNRYSLPSAKKVAKVNTHTSDSSVHPTNDAREKQSLGVAQLESKGVWVIALIAQNVCEVTFVVNLVDKGKIPTSLVNASIGSALNAATFLKAFYERTNLVVDAEVRLEAREMEWKLYIII